MKKEKMRHLWLNYCILLKLPMTHQSMFGGLQKGLGTWEKKRIFFAVPFVKVEGWIA